MRPRSSSGSSIAMPNVLKLEPIITVRRPHRQRMSSAANALLCNIGEGKQCNLLSYFSALQHLCGTRSCGKRARKGHFHGHEHTCTHTGRQSAQPPTLAPPKCSPACAAAPAPRPRRQVQGRRLGASWLRAKLTSGHPRHAGGAHLVPRGRAASGAGALCPPSGSRRGRASRRPLRCRPRRRQALQGGAAKLRRARCAIFPRRCRARRRPALQPRAGTYTWHRSRQSWWSSARAARRSALRCATPPRPVRNLPSA